MIFPAYLLESCLSVFFLGTLKLIATTGLIGRLPRIRFFHSGFYRYEGKRLTFNGIRTNTKVIRHDDFHIRSGFITEDTKLTFRSRSARIIWLVQMSAEMWDFASPYEAMDADTISHESCCKTYFGKGQIWKR